ncbi:protein of unknown function (plasmid) [Rhodovastum atsumiense]|nr:protein of unknown function [Rhodovastum atsumiense]
MATGGCGDRHLSNVPGVVAREEASTCGQRSGDICFRVVAASARRSGKGAKLPDLSSQAMWPLHLYDRTLAGWR